MTTLPLFPHAHKPISSLDHLEAFAGYLANRAAAKMNLPDRKRRQHWLDLKHEALAALWQYRDYHINQAMTAAIGEVCSYISGLIYGGTRKGWDQCLAREYDSFNIEALEGDSGRDPYEILGHIMTRAGIPRPPEDALLEPHENIDQLERELTGRLFEIFIGLRDNWHARSLYLGAQAQAKAMLGYSFDLIAEELEIPRQCAVSMVMEHRTWLAEFAELSPLHQGIIEARGALRVYRQDNPDPHILTAGHKFVAVMDAGIFVAYARHDKRPGRVPRLEFQEGRRIGGHLKMIRVGIGPIASVTPELIAGKAWQMQRKVTAGFGRVSAFLEGAY